MKKMVEMDCCDVCGKPLYVAPDYIEGYAFKDAEGNKFDAVLCENCAEDKVFECVGCGCYLRNEDVFHVDCSDYCEQCAEELLEDKRQEVKNLEADLKDAREAFERRKAERE